MSLRNLISIADVSLDDWDRLYSRCCDIIAHPGDYADACRGKILTSLFFEPSTRTNFSFQAAMLRLGGGVFGFADPSATSASKGETLADTIRMVSAYADAIVMRSPLEGAARAASLYSDLPIINAGDGGHMHPTQTLADLTTISQKRGGISNLTVGLCGDLKHGRTVHSLVLALSKFPGMKFRLISPDELRMPEYMLNYMRENGQEYVEMTDLEASLSGLDILYMTRVQRERFADPLEYDRLRDVYVLTMDKLRGAKADLLVMHPLPRVGEIAQEVDGDPRAVYFEQARYGMFIRMALLLELCRLPRIAPETPDAFSAIMCANPACVTQAEPYLPALTASGNATRCGYCDKKLLTFQP